MSGCKTYTIIETLGVDLKRIAFYLKPSILEDLGIETTLNWHIKDFKKKAQLIEKNQTEYSFLETQ